MYSGWNPCWNKPLSIAGWATRGTIRASATNSPQYECSFIAVNAQAPHVTANVGGNRTATFAAKPQRAVVVPRWPTCYRSPRARQLRCAF